MRKILLTTLLLIFMVSPAFAEAPKLIDSFKDWDAYAYKESGSKVCFMSSIPTESKGNYTYRGDIVFMVTHRPADKTKDVVSFTTGYNFKADSEATLTIDNKKWNLFTDQDKAWASTEKMDSEIASAIKSGSKMTVEGTSSRGTYTKDTFSLKGSSAAYKEISSACGY
jgi:invasion protein IalB